MALDVLSYFSEINSAYVIIDDGEPTMCCVSI